MNTITNEKVKCYNCGSPLSQGTVVEGVQTRKPTETLCSQCRLSLEKVVGIYNPDAYYKKGMWSNLDLSIEDTVKYDRHLLRSLRNTLLSNTPIRVLLAGCACITSTHVMAHDLVYMFGTNVELVVVDLDAENIQKQQEQWDYYNKYENIPLQPTWIVADLLHLPADLGIFHYIRMDYTQNFLEQDLQVPLLKTLTNNLHPNGIIATNIGKPEWDQHKVSKTVHPESFRKKEPDYVTIQFSEEICLRFFAQAGLRVIWQHDIETYEDHHTYDENGDPDIIRSLDWTANFYAVTR